MTFPFHSFDATQAFGSALGRFIWPVLTSRRRLVSQGLARHMGYDSITARHAGMQSFMHTGRSFAELLLTRTIDHRFVHHRVSSNDFQLFIDMLHHDRPVVATTAHLGSWELLSGLLSLYNSKKQALIVVRHPKNRLLAALMSHFRRHHNVDVAHKDKAAPKVLRCLKKNGVTAFLVDHNTGRSKAMFMPFLNDIAAVNMGPALLALRAKALVWPIFLVRNGPGHFFLSVDEPLDTLDLIGSTEDKIKSIAVFYTHKVQEMVERFPEQWFWMHNRWKNRPKGSPVIDPHEFQISEQHSIK